MINMLKIELKFWWFYILSQLLYQQQISGLIIYSYLVFQ